MTKYMHKKRPFYDLGGRVCKKCGNKTFIKDEFLTLVKETEIYKCEYCGRIE